MSCCSRVPPDLTAMLLSVFGIESFQLRGECQSPSIVKFFSGGYYTGRTLSHLWMSVRFSETLTTPDNSNTPVTFPASPLELSYRHKIKYITYLITSQTVRTTMNAMAPRGQIWKSRRVSCLSRDRSTNRSACQQNVINNHAPNQCTESINA